MSLVQPAFPACSQPIAAHTPCTTAHWPSPVLGLSMLPLASGLLHVLFSLARMLFPLPFCLVNPFVKQCKASLSSYFFGYTLS